MNALLVGFLLLVGLVVGLVLLYRRGSSLRSAADRRAEVVVRATPDAADEPAYVPERAVLGMAYAMILRAQGDLGVSDADALAASLDIPEIQGLSDEQWNAALWLGTTQALRMVRDVLIDATGDVPVFVGQQLVDRAALEAGLANLLPSDGASGTVARW